MTFVSENLNNWQMANRKFNSILTIILGSLLWMNHSVQAATVYTSKTELGVWSCMCSWTVTGSGSPIVYNINAGHRMIIDKNADNVDSLYIHGVLVMENAVVLTLNSSGVILVSKQGKLEGGNNATKIKFGSATETAISGPFLHSNQITNGPRYANYNSMIAASGEPQPSFPALLPDGILSVTVTQIEGIYNIQWIATGNNNKSTFEIELSLNGTDFQTTGTIAGKATNQKTSYTFNLGNQQSNFFVRLKEIKPNGTSEIATRFVNLVNSQIGALKVFPTMVTASTQELKLVLPAPGNQVMKIYNYAMQEIASAEFITVTDSELKSFDISNIHFTSGTYLVVVVNVNGFKQTSRIVVP